MLKRSLIALLLMSSFAAQAEGAEFKKENAIMRLAVGNDDINFSINASVDQSACYVTGAAKIIDDHRAAYTENDPSDLCVILFNFENTDRIKVTTKDCGGYCGLGAKGAMDGIYSNH